ncbi:hypothetical protein FOCC_FOCC012227 [Frankliniella occidentalis]|nr:hypothetical protein FOCC_FOCC012227 [Frankliniella occidentalis]
MPKVSHVNWFREGNDGKFLWSGFGKNSRVLDGIVKRVEGEGIAKKTPVGYVPTAGSLRLDGLKEKVDMKQLFSLPKDFWIQEVRLHIAL